MKSALLFPVAMFIPVAMLAGCKPPIIVPTPPPPVIPDYYSELRLTTQGPNFIYADGEPFELRKVVFCCKDTVGTGWPGLSESAVDHAYNQGRATLLHWRAGPFRACNEPEWAATGGGFSGGGGSFGGGGAGGAYVEQDGIADLSQFNQRYFDAMVARIKQAGSYGMNVEISLTDGWAVKTQRWQSNGIAPCWHPWHSAGNVQGQDHLSRAWRGSLDPVHRIYVQQVIAVAGPYQNVIFEDGTEPDQIPGASITWSLEMESILRAKEAENGWPAHLFGTNFKADPAFPFLARNRLQYLNAHDTQPTAASVFWGSDPMRPYVTDEYNPEPPMKPEAVAAFYQYGRAHGTYWAAWRHDQDTNAWNASLSLIAQGGQPGWEDGCPYDVAPTAHISCRRHSNNLWDCTSKTSTDQPIRPEGDITRALCERASLRMGPADRISYRLVNTLGTIGLNPRPNIFQFVLTGEPLSTGTLQCYAPSAPTVELCRGPEVIVR